MDEELRKKAEAIIELQKELNEKAARLLAMINAEDIKVSDVALDDDIENDAPYQIKGKVAQPVRRPSIRSTQKKNANTFKSLATKILEMKNKR